MNILITNTELIDYSGTTVVVRDLSRELQRQGHEPLVYSPRLGPVAEEIRGHGIEITNRLDRLSRPPDVIHGHHHFQVVEALLHFPRTPAIFVCHSAAHFKEEPFYFPRILRYVAVDDLCRKRIEKVREIPPGRINVILNAVDMARFQPRAPLPAKPRQALVFSNYASNHTHLPAVRRACRQTGLKLDVLGAGAKNAVPNPETVLRQYDIVFAKARCALEAMAAGNAVVLCDFAGAGPLVTKENFDTLRRMNFGAGVLTNPLRAEFIRVEIERYDPHDAAEVSRRAHTEAGVEEATRCWIALYRDVIQEFRQSRQDFDEESRALGVYLQRWNYEKRLEWELRQLDRLKRSPLLGAAFRHFGWPIVKKLLRFKDELN
ncbi:MAG TPA: glycosyltransferase [Verrucomicrobiae bacterium]|nr:glycosyltransferase [Verrucomicrobiae bacterium]